MNNTNKALNTWKRVMRVRQTEIRNIITNTKKRAIMSHIKQEEGKKKRRWKMENNTNKTVNKREEGDENNRKPEQKKKRENGIRER